MATKKQKRAAALAKRERFLEEVKKDGLAAQERDHEERARKKSQPSVEVASPPKKRKKNREETDMEAGLRAALNLSQSMPLIGHFANADKK